MCVEHTLLRVGLTGGIASGKSTVAALLEECGAYVVDADRLARQALTPGSPAFDQVVEQFGRRVLDGSGAIDRAGLARLVFADSRARETLNGIVHPYVRAEAARRMQIRAAEGRTRVAVFDAALLVETGAHRDLDRLIVVRCTRETQIRRLAQRDGLNRQEAAARIAAQASLADKLAVADFVIDTDRTLEETREQTRQVYEELLEEWRRRRAAHRPPADR